MNYFKCIYFYFTAQAAELSEWDEWSACNATCGIGNRARFRMCVNPPLGSSECTGNLQELQECESQDCGKYVNVYSVLD